MFRSEAALSKDMSGIHLRSSYSGANNQATFKHDFFQTQSQAQAQNQNQNQSQQQGGGGSGLARYRSAPSTFLGALLEVNGDNNSSSGDEAEAFFSALMEGPRDLNSSKSGYNHQMQYSMKQEVEKEAPVHVQNGYENGGAVVGSYSVGMESSVALHGSRSGNNSSSSLGRQSSSPAGFLNGFSVMGDVGSYRVHGEASSSHGNLNHMAFSSGPSSGSRFMPSIPENGGESIGASSSETGRLRNGNQAAFPQNSWNDSQFKSLKRNRDSDLTMFPNFNDFETQNGETRKGLVHHLSLPANTSKMAVTEKILHFQPETTVPCQMRAKRGCATHPRSIAERNRRTRISEKMKKLQDLFPTMDKQTNTADMLDLAVDYIKDLQKQLQMLTDKKAKCVCSIKSQ